MEETLCGQQGRPTGGAFIWNNVKLHCELRPGESLCRSISVLHWCSLCDGRSNILERSSLFDKMSRCCVNCVLVRASLAASFHSNSAPSCVGSYDVLAKVLSISKIHVRFSRRTALLMKFRGMSQCALNGEYTQVRLEVQS